MSMRVAMLNLTGGGLSGGYRKYLQELVPRLQAHPGVGALLQVLPPAYTTLTGPDNGARWTWQPGEQWRGYPALRERVRAWKPDVVLIPTARFMDCHAPCVSMVRNMEPMLPPTFADGAKAWARNHLAAHVARRAAARSTRVIAVSGFVRDYLVNTWHVDERRVGVVYHGVERPGAGVAPPAQLLALGDTPFFFTAGSLLRYRGLEDVITALAQLGASRARLAIAGDGSAVYRQQMDALAGTLGVADRIVWLGHLGETAMTWAYTSSVAYVMTSRVEACPNTALEAMASGALCISTDSRPMPEFFGDGALYYGAGHAPELAAHMRCALSMGRPEASALRGRATRRSLDFGWAATADGTVQQLEAATADHQENAGTHQGAGVSGE